MISSFIPVSRFVTSKFPTKAAEITPRLVKKAATFGSADQKTKFLADSDSVGQFIFGATASVVAVKTLGKFVPDSKVFFFYKLCI
mmetsp:Transcript_19210/g.31981  ORF Transcript_19210/g.31981 Transcript_19210/m.31981 type:complete len:85 (+) Transcript_19210:231-485(+)